jgi:hypothetical protein
LIWLLVTIVSGKCCTYMLDGKLKRCKYLVKLNSNRTLCRVYATRLGRILDTSSDGKTMIRCMLKKDSSIHYDTCPYDKDYFANLNKK